MKTLAISLVAMFSFIGLVFSPASIAAVENPVIEIPINTIVRGDKDSEHNLASEAVPADYVGMTCKVVSTAKNQGSVHPGNDLVVSSGSDSITLADVEREANVLTEADGPLTLGNTLDVTLVMGKDKVFSGGMVVEVHCDEKPPEMCEFNPELPVDHPDCYEPCEFNPELPIDDPNCYEPCEFDPELPVGDPNCFEPCEFDPTLPADHVDCGEVEGEVTPEELPNTGAGSIAMGAISLSAIAATGKTWLESRKK